MWRFCLPPGSEAERGPAPRSDGEGGSPPGQERRGDEEWVALLGWGSAALKSSPRDTWIGWSSEQRMRRLKYVVNNSRFLVLPGIHVRNLASRTLSLNVKRLSSDWQAIYGHSLLLGETFVDQSLCAGTCYTQEHNSRQHSTLKCIMGVSVSCGRLACSWHDSWFSS